MKKRAAKRQKPKKKVKANKKKGKNIVPLLLFILALILLLYLSDYLGMDAKLKQSPVDREKDIIAEKLIEDSDIALMKQEGVIEKESLEKLSSMSYYEIKSRLGVTSDFMLYMVDAEGNIIPVNGKTCIGSPKAKVAGQQCS